MDRFQGGNARRTRWSSRPCWSSVVCACRSQRGPAGTTQPTYRCSDAGREGRPRGKTTNHRNPQPLRFVRPTREKIEKGVPMTFTKNEEKELKKAVGGAAPFFHHRMPRAALLYCLVASCLSMVCSPQAPPLLHWDAGPTVYGLCHVPVLGRLHFVRH
eukprot:COSAG01_NODE_12765_length_1689_cov_1.267296_4_plen_158_part_00